ncbi:hypothetical protein ABL78_0045 [Leptomonas seymouri]|uniref:Uncharacterized protein n=1 Tax=Leptomonas seymouri TaxID=5684 RepID=A0A0N1PGP1_LEPSE|nr:hypothetical protein ABL78_0045 [Leptomonas seymouri]|eukprot:KPI90812.1 hypothetical protein ABL78_0045 [Leptomonas seymouri]
MQPSDSVKQPIAVLRESLLSILHVLNSMTAATSCERALMEERRRKVLNLLVDLSPDEATDTHPQLVSPIPDPGGVGSALASPNEDDPQDNEAPLAGGAYTFPVPPHRFLGNVFSFPSPIPPNSHIAAVESDVKGTNSHHRACVVQLRPVSPSHPDTLKNQGKHPQTSWPNVGRGGPTPCICWHNHDAKASEITSSCSFPKANDHHSKPQNRQLPAVRIGAPSPRRAACAFDCTCATPSFWIHVWPCFGSTVCCTLRPTRVLVRGCYRFFEDVVERAAAQTKCQPACPSLYTPEGRPVWGLEELRAEQHYLLFPSGGYYRKQAVPTALLWLLYSDAKHIVQRS